MGFLDFGGQAVWFWISLVFGCLGFGVMGVGVLLDVFLGGGDSVGFVRVMGLAFSPRLNLDQLSLGHISVQRIVFFEMTIKTRLSDLPYHDII